MLAIGLLAAVAAFDVIAAWKWVGRNHGIVEQEHVEARHPFDP